MTKKQTSEAAPAAVYLDPKTLIAWDKNPRNNDEAVASVSKSIQRFGFASPIIARESDGRIIAGHTRLKAALSLGLDSVPVRFMDLDDQSAAALALADNRIGEIATWDDDGLSAILADLEANAVDLDGLGWDADELADLLTPTFEPDGSEDDVPEVQAEVHSVPGEVYELGPHRLVCGDCRDPAVVADLMDGDSIVIAFTSPPYASQRVYDETSGFKPIAPDDYVAWFEPVQAAVREHLASDGSWFVNIKEHCDDGQRSLYVKDLTIAHVRAWGWRFVDEFCWKKNPYPGAFVGRFKNGFEPVFHFSLGFHKFRHEAVSIDSFGVVNATHAPLNKTQGKGLSGSGRAFETARPSNVVECSGTDALGHEAAFPVALPVFFVKAYTDPGDVVFDPFMGSGTTLIAAAQEGRRGYGCEISAQYCDVIRRRWTKWANEHGQEPGPGALETEAM